VSKIGHPNINAAGFASDIVTSLTRRLRGQADAEGNSRHAYTVLRDRITEFVTDVSDILDREFPVDDPLTSTDSLFPPELSDDVLLLRPGVIAIKIREEDCPSEDSGPCGSAVQGRQQQQEEQGALLLPVQSVEG
jgi:hypothetical protein